MVAAVHMDDLAGRLRKEVREQRCAAESDGLAVGAHVPPGAGLVPRWVGTCTPTARPDSGLAALDLFPKTTGEISPCGQPPAPLSA